MFYFHFWGRLFSKHWSVEVGEKDVGSASSTHCSNKLFCGHWTGNCLREKYYIKLPRNFVIFEWIWVVFVFVSIWLSFLHLVFLLEALFIRVNIYWETVYTNRLFHPRLAAVTLQVLQKKSKKTVLISGEAIKFVLKNVKKWKFKSWKDCNC